MSKTVPVNERLGEMLNYAVRYAIGRRTYAPHDVVKYVEPLVPDLDKATLHVMHYDIVAAQDKPGGLGDDNIDAPDWLRLLGKIDHRLQCVFSLGGDHHTPIPRFRFFLTQYSTHFPLRQ